MTDDKTAEFLGCFDAYYSEIHLGTVEHVVHTSFEAWMHVTGGAWYFGSGYMTVDALTSTGRLQKLEDVLRISL